MKRKVLVVDDTKDIADEVKNILEEEGHHVEIAYNGLEAQVLLSAKHFDLIISDVNMPTCNGIELLQWVVKHHSQTPFILTSSDDLPPGVSGYKAFLPKDKMLFHIAQLTKILSC